MKASVRDMAKRLKRLRTKKGLNQRSLGESMNVNANYISKLEHGLISRPCPEVLIKYGSQFNVSLDFIISGQEFNPVLK